MGSHGKPWGEKKKYAGRKSMVEKTKSVLWDKVEGD